LKAKEKIMSKLIKSKVSITAQGTCLMRAISYFEKNPCYKSGDFIAAAIQPSFLATMAKYNFLRTLLKKALFKVPGIYEYVISRTHFIDEIFKSDLSSIEQVLIFGAGFDSRAIRFEKELKNIKVFEIDAPPTQQAKRSRFIEKSIDFPTNLKFISFDLTQEALVDKLEEAGFQRNRKCLILLEGLTYYLPQETIISILNFINSSTAKGSQIIFDYAVASAVNPKSSPAGIEKHYQSLVKAGERPGFIVEGEIQDFLKTYNVEIVEELDSVKLAKRYFSTDDFEPAAQQFRLVRAVKEV
jgi:methyltransferase (TIGR00027 family)